MILVVIDTGIVVSAAFRDRTPEEIILFIVGNEDFEWIVSPEISTEYNEVLSRKKFDLPPQVLKRWCDIFDVCTTTIEPNIKIDFPQDQKDTMFLECALTAEADYLITGDKDFEDARKLVQTTIISVSQFSKFVMKDWS